MPTLTDPGARHVDSGRRQVLAEVAVPQRAPQPLLPVVEVFARVRVHGLVVAAVQLLVADDVGVEAAADPATLGPWRPDRDRLIRRDLVDAGERRGLVGVGPRPGEIDRQDTWHGVKTRTMSGRRPLAASRVWATAAMTASSPATTASRPRCRR